jgi:hypothetical protein
MKASAISRMKVSFTLAAALCEEEGVGVGVRGHSRGV